MGSKVIELHPDSMKGKEFIVPAQAVEAGNYRPLRDRKEREEDRQKVSYVPVVFQALNPCPQFLCCHGNPPPLSYTHRD